MWLAPLPLDHDLIYWGALTREGIRGVEDAVLYISTSVHQPQPSALSTCRDAEMQRCRERSAGCLLEVSWKEYRIAVGAKHECTSHLFSQGRIPPAEKGSLGCPRRSVLLQRWLARTLATQKHQVLRVPQSRHPAIPRTHGTSGDADSDDNGTLLHTSRSSTGDAASPPLRSLLFTLLLSVLPRLPSPCTGQNAWRDSPGIVEKILMHVVTDYLEVTSKASVFPSPTSVRGAAQDHSSRSAHCPCSTTNRW